MVRLQINRTPYLLKSLVNVHYLSRKCFWYLCLRVCTCESQLEVVNIGPIDKWRFFMRTLACVIARKPRMFMTSFDYYCSHYCQVMLIAHI